MRGMTSRFGEVASLVCELCGCPFDGRRELDEHRAGCPMRRWYERTFGHSSEHPRAIRAMGKCPHCLALVEQIALEQHAEHCHFRRRRSQPPRPEGAPGPRNTLEPVPDGGISDADLAALYRRACFLGREIVHCVGTACDYDHSLVGDLRGKLATAARAVLELGQRYDRYRSYATGRADLLHGSRVTEQVNEAHARIEQVAEVLRADAADIVAQLELTLARAVASAHSRTSEAALEDVRVICSVVEEIHRATE